MIFRFLVVLSFLFCTIVATICSCAVNPAHVDFSSEPAEEPANEDIYRINSAAIAKDGNLYALSPEYLYKIVEKGSGHQAQKLMENEDYLIGLLRDRAGNLIARSYYGLYQITGAGNSRSADVIYNFNHIGFYDKYTLDAQGNLWLLDYDYCGNLLFVCWDGQKKTIDTVTSAVNDVSGKVCIASSGDTVFLVQKPQSGPIFTSSFLRGNSIHLDTLTDYDSAILLSSFSLSNELYLVFDIPGRMVLKYSETDSDDSVYIHNKSIITRLIDGELLYVSDSYPYSTNFLRNAPDEGLLFSNHHIMKITPEKTVLKEALTLNGLFLDNSGSAVMFYAPTLRLIKLEDLPDF